jgi:hypothetical protein
MPSCCSVSRRNPSLNQEILALAGVTGAYDVVQELSISRLLGLAGRASGMISVDTGPAHLAAAVGCTVVALFGRTEPFMYAPRGRTAVVHCLVGEHEGERSMRYITPAAGPGRLAGRAATPMINPVSLIVITYNEAANIARCLDSVGFAAEKIVVDCGSDDDTRTIAADSRCPRRRPALARVRRAAQLRQRPGEP